MRKGRVLAGLAGAAVVLIVIGTAASGGNQTAPASPSTSVPASAYTQTQPTVTYRVWGSPADVTYGPAGSDFSGPVPLRVTRKIPSNPPAYYSISAQLNGGGTVNCSIAVDGKVISKSVASGSYNIASCEIQQDIISNNWIDSNGN